MNSNRNEDKTNTSAINTTHAKLITDGEGEDPGEENMNDAKEGWVDANPNRVL